jgi:hypothetical protein|tara:strand:- start:409 stop:516 length:108 start_codon:yes stop_codon:yes gene_type:complete
MIRSANLKKKKIKEAYNLIGALLILSGGFCLWDDG